MKILHTSDWHLGKSDGDRGLLEDQRFFIDEICRIVKERNVGAVIIAGDVYDRQISSAEAVQTYDRAMTRLCRELKTKVIIIAGNHDSAERLSSCADLLSAAGLYVSGALKREPDVVSFEDTDVYLLPWFTEEKARSVFFEKREEIGSYEDAYRAALDNIRSHFDGSKKHIVVSHAYITSAETSVSDRAAEIGFASQVNADVFEGFDYVALGHIHKPQDVGKNIRYSGTPMPYAFGKEETQQKSVTLIDTVTLEKEIIPLPLLHRRTTLKGTFDELTCMRADEDVRSGYVRLELTDCCAGLEITSALREVYPNVLEIYGKTYESGDAAVTLTIEDLRRMETDPSEVFKQFCAEVIGEEADDRRKALFDRAVRETEDDE